MRQRKIIYLLIALLLLAIVGACLALNCVNSSVIEGDEPVAIDIYPTDTPESVYSKLSPSAGSRAMKLVKMMLEKDNYGESIHTGHYVFGPTDNVRTVCRRLKNGEQTPIMLTIPESRTMQKLASFLGQKLMTDSAELSSLLSNNDFCKAYGYDTATIACLFVPNTYEVYWNMSPDGLLKRMQREHDSFWNTERLSKAAAIGLTPNEVCTLASIIDEETANNAEKPMIAGMYLNRLKKHMLLQADPTVKFAMKEFGLRRILNRHLTTDSPWNTYRYAGLPPGPIKIASIKGIDAVLSPASHDYLYMCAKEDFSGTHNFATNMQEHLQNARRYQQALNQRGIKK